MAILPAWAQTPSLTITATNPGGATNNGTAQLGAQVNFLTSVVNGGVSPRTWTLQGAGTLTPNNTNNAGAAYLPPSAMPANTSVTITATTTGSPIVSASYTLTLVNPVPAVVSANPTHASAGGTVSVVLTGTGFVPGTVLTASSGTVTTTYNSPTSVTAQVTVPATASGNLSLTPQNPTPGGGTGAAFALPIAALTMTATNPDGTTNNGTAQLGAQVNFLTSVVNGAISPRAWTLQGGGTLTPNNSNNAGAAYVAPSATPANPSVTITATTTASPIVSTSYTLTLFNPVPAISSGSPNQVVAGGTTSVVLTGTGFVPGTVLTASSGTVTTIYNSPTSITAQVTAPATASGNLSLTPQNPTPGGGAGAALVLTLLNPVPVINSASPNQALEGGTTSLVLTGTGFVPGTVLTASSGTVTTTYNSPTSITAQVTLPATASGNLSLTPQNPTPGGGAGNPLSLPIAALTMTATNPGGTPNYGTAQLGAQVNFLTSVVNGGVSPTVWTLQGAGTLTPNNTNNSGAAYMAPSAMPANTSVTVTASTTASPIVSSSYTLTLVNPVPVISSASPNQVLAGGTTSIVLTGTGFVPGTVLTSSSGAVTTTYNSPTSITAQITLPATALGNVSLTAQNPTPGGGTGAAFALTVGNPVPVISSASPSQAVAGGTTSIVLTGTGFVSGTVLTSSSGTVSTTYNSPTSITAQITLPATASGNLSLTPQNPTPGGGAGAALSLTVVNPVPVITSASLTQAVAGGTASVVLTGTGFVPGTVVTASFGTATTIYNSPTSITAQITVPATASGSLLLTPQNPTPGGGTGAVFALPVVNPMPVINSASPNQAVTGGTVSVVLTGTGFVPATVLTASSGTITTTYNSPTSITAQITLPATASGNLSLVPQSPTPGGGTGAAFALPIAALAMTATNPDGTTNNGTAQLGAQVNFITSVVNGGVSPRTWALQGAGTLTPDNTNNSGAAYVAPSVMPANPSLTITATTTASPIVSTSYTLTLLNPIPVISSASSNQAVAGGMVSIVLTGTGFVSGTVLTASSGTVTTTFNSPTSITAQITLPTSASGNLSLVPQNPTPGGGTGAALALTVVNPVPVISSASPNQTVAGGTVSVALTGTGFVPGTVLTAGSGTVTTTYNSPTSITAQVTLPATASGNVSLTPQNPTPGGGTGAAFALPISALTMTATNSGGTPNNGTAQLGVQVNLITSIVSGGVGPRTWTLQGAGTLTPNNTNNSGAAYMPPSVMPANAAVTIQAALASTPAVTASYTLTLVNPVPVVSLATPTAASSGGTVSLVLTGTGFVSGTVLTASSGTVTTTYNSPTSITAQITLPTSASGNVSLTPQNPTPGGGTGAAFVLPVATLTMQATNSGGTPNNGTAQLGVQVNFLTSVVNAGVSPRTWTLQGAGTLTPNNTNNSGAAYMPPAAMPANPNVTITATTTASPIVSTSYTLTLVNPVPTISSSSPSQALAGATVPITISGTGFVPGTVILINGVAAPTTYQSATAVVAQVTAAAAATGSLSAQPQNPAPGGGTGTAFQLSIATLKITSTDPDGTNTGTARLGVPVNLTTINTDTTHTGITWSVQGGGTLTTSGYNNGGVNGNATYTPPQAMPANPTVTVSAWLANLPALTTSYTLTLINPVPAVSSATPAQLLTGGTQTVTLTGSGFVPGTTVAFNGQSLPITYVSFNQATAQVPVANTASGTLSLQVQNPAPGGGAGTTFTESVATPSIALTATGVDGVNTGFADLDFNVAMSAAVSGSMQTAVNWSIVSGPGSISSAGVYTPPATMPVAPNTHWATIQAALASNPAVTASYGVDIVNPVPTITAASPAILPAGATTAVTFTGTGFVPSTVIESNGAAMPTTYVSPTSITAEISVIAAATGDLQMQAYTATGTGGISDFFPVAISAPVSLTTAGRLLDQTTFGPTTSLIQHVQNEGVTAWLQEQFNTPQTVLPAIPNPLPSYCSGDGACFESEWWQTAITGNDQLRQRVAFALSEMFVISSHEVTDWDLQNYANILAADAFTNWHTIMNDVTLSPGMGYYLNMLNSTAPTGTLSANENFARENMQLFNMGLDLLNQDGSLQLDGNGNPIPAYTQAQVQAFARVFTGWTYANADGSTPSVINWVPNYTHPMVAVESQHDENSKTLLSGVTLPAGQTAEEDLDAALSDVFWHPNVPPFVCQQLIQHLVKSDPSPAYISRVAAKFIDDGNGVRGDMQAVLTAIFTDPEARAGDTAEQPSDGHLREPILWITGVWRGLGFVNVDPNNYWESLSNLSASFLSERPYQSPAVFNFFPPSYVIPGTSLNAPEFGIENTATVMGRLSVANNTVFNSFPAFNVDLSATSPLGQVLATQGPAALVQALNNLFLYGTMDSATATAITNEITNAPGVTPAEQIRLAVYLVITSTQYKILH